MLPAAFPRRDCLVGFAVSHSRLLFSLIGLLCARVWELLQTSSFSEGSRIRRMQISCLGLFVLPQCTQPDYEYRLRSRGPTISATN